MMTGPGGKGRGQLQVGDRALMTYKMNLPYPVGTLVLCRVLTSTTLAVSSTWCRR